MRRNIVYTALEEFRNPQKLIRLSRMTLEVTKGRVKIEDLSETFNITI